MFSDRDYSIVQPATIGCDKCTCRHCKNGVKLVVTMIEVHIAVVCSKLHLYTCTSESNMSALSYTIKFERIHVSVLTDENFVFNITVF